jgi:phospholipid/cholesterol/gamma-HCH transport system substrate-binding protein
MEPEAKYTLVGTALLVLLALVVAAAVWLKSTGGQRYDEPYKIYFAHQSLEGLQIRGDVKMQGIKVGSVTGFRISSRRPGSVEVLIRVDGTTPVRQATSASIERHLLTGIASIRLVNSSEGSPALGEAPPEEPYPVITEGESAYQFSQSMAQLAQRADETMQRINLVLSDENQVALREILVTLRRISANVDRSMPDLDRALLAIRRGADQLGNTSTEIAGDARKLAARYDTLGEESTTTMKELALAIRQMRADVTRLATQMDGVLTDGNIDFRVTARELRATADALGVAARRFGEPNRILFGPAKSSLGPGESLR